MRGWYNHDRQEAVLSEVITKEQFSRAAELLLSWQRPLLITHERPDGDGLGCVIALREILLLMGKAPVAMLFEPCQGRYSVMEGIGGLAVMESADEATLGDVDGVVIVDTSSYEQLRPVADWLCNCDLPKIVVDHHVSGEAIGDIHLTDSGAGSAALVVYRWLRSCGWQSCDIANKALFVGMATDTGWFRYSNTCPEAMRAAADLMELGVDVDETFSRFYLQDDVSRLRFLGLATAGLEFFHKDALAVMSVSREAMERQQLAVVDTEGIVNTPMTVGVVEVAVLLLEQADGLVKCSLRSKGKVDVARLAESFGGGGHSRAAGVRIPGLLADVKSEMVSRVGALLG